jgi:hypothetical protein
MTWLYYIEPEEGPFPEEALASWRAFLASVPARRRADGIYQVFETLGELAGLQSVVDATGAEHCDGAPTRLRVALAIQDRRRLGDAADHREVLRQHLHAAAPAVLGGTRQCDRVAIT